MESLSRYLLVSSAVLFFFVFYRWLKRYLHRNEITQPFPYVYPFARQLFAKPEALRFELPEGGAVSIELINDRGQVVAVLLSAEMPAGTHDTLLDFSKQTPGAYELRLSFPRQTTTRHIKIYA